MNIFFDQTINGLVIGNIYALMAVGLALIFGTANLINFAHGSVYMAGAYVGWTCVTYFGFPLFLTFLVVMLFCALLGMLIERIGLRPLQNSARIAPLLATIGISFILDQLAQIIFTPQPLALPPLISTKRFAFGATSIGVLDILIASVSLISGALLYAFLRYTRMGWAVRATAQDRDAAQQMGVDVNRVNQVTFAIASALGGLSGMLVAMYFNVLTPTMGFQAGLKGFAAGLIGGLGNVPGAIIGSLMLGLIESYGVALWGSSYRNLFAFVILLVVLVLKPNGIFSKGRQLPPEPMTGTFAASSKPLQIPRPVLIGVTVFAFLLPVVFTNNYWLSVFTTALLYGILALSLTLVAGTAGLMSIGHAGLLAIGGYASALLSLRLGLPFPLALLLAACITAILGMLLVMPAFRLRGHYVSIATIGIGEIVSLTILNWESLTGGPVGLMNIPPPSLFGFEFYSNRSLYWLSLVLLIGLALLQWQLVRSHIGRTLRAIREDEVAAQAYGINLNRYKGIAFAASGFIAGIAGVILTHSYTYINNETFNNTISVLALTMVILGGRGNIIGSILGAALLIIIPELLRGVLGESFIVYRMLLYGLLLVLFVRWRPQGLLGTV